MVKIVGKKIEKNGPHQKVWDFPDILLRPFLKEIDLNKSRTIPHRLMIYYELVNIFNAHLNRPI